MLGHGAPDYGVVLRDEIVESEVNLNIAFKLQNLLEQSGTTVILTRHDENGIYEIDKKTIRQKKVSDIKNRVDIGNGSSADMFVSIHLNKIPEEQYSGWQTFYGKNNENGEKLAKAIQENLNQVMKIENKRKSLVINGKYIIDHVTIPTTIVECGFISNKEEAEKLKLDEYQDKLAWGIYNGIIDYFYE